VSSNLAAVRRRPSLPAWAGRDFRLLAASALITGLGTSGTVVAAAFAVLGAGGTGTDVGLVAAARTAPLVVFLLIGGAVADRLPRHRVMVAANLLNASSQAVFAALVLTGQARIWQMAVLSALAGTAQAFFSPASEGMVLSSVQGAHASQAFAVYRVGVNGATIAGAAVGGALIAAFGPGVVLAVDAGSFAVAALLRAFLRVGTAERQRTGGLWADLREGWREFAARRWLWGVVVQFSVVNAVIAAAESVYGPQVADARLGGAGPWGLALAAGGVGNVLGGLLMLRWRPRRILLAGTLCVFPYALPAVALAVPVPVPLLVVTMFVSGCSIEVFGVTWMMALHQEIPHEMLSRISAYDWFGSVAMVPLGTAAAGPVAAAVGMPGALWGCAGLTLLLTGAVLLAPEVRRLERAPGAVAKAAPSGPVPAAAAPSDGAAPSP
jgi:MFS family permease